MKQSLEKTAKSQPANRHHIGLLVLTLDRHEARTLALQHWPSVRLVTTRRLSPTEPLAAATRLVRVAMEDSQLEITHTAGVRTTLIGGSCHKSMLAATKLVATELCFVATNRLLPRQKTCFVATSLLLSRQNYVCRDKTTKGL